MSFTVAIDGPAAAGKGTIARAVASEFGLAHLDTGLLYRAVGARVLEGEPAIDVANALSATDLEDPDRLRNPAIAQQASRVAAIPEVRAALLDFQRAFARRAGGAVLDGRDIGTVICPWAHSKLFVHASENVRARRRFDELRARGLDIEFEAVLADVRARDARDADRATAPLICAADAVLLDTSELTIQEACAAAFETVGKHLLKTAR